MAVIYLDLGKFMKTNIISITKVGLVAAVMSVMILPLGAWAAESNPATNTYGPWSVANVASDSSDWRIESYKVDKNLLAWTELSVGGNQRRLYVYDGVSTRLLAGLDVNEWNVPQGDTGFYDQVSGAYDVADGQVVWLQWDGHDREVYGWSGESTYRVSDNGYDDRHPITSGGQVVWSSYPTNQAYNLMHKDATGWRVLASWHVLNYKFSGDRLYWLNKQSGENWFRVFTTENGKLPVTPIGKGDDRPLPDYFTVDGSGSAVWEFSTKRWDWDKREIFHSVNGASAYRDIQRDVPPNEIRIEDVDGNRLAMNDKDWFFQNLEKRTTLQEFINGFPLVIWNKPTLAKVRYMDGGSVRHREVSDGDNSLIFRTYAGAEHFIGFEAVVRDRFDADGAAAAGARVGSDLIAFSEMETTVIDTEREVADLKVRDGEIAWIEGEYGNQTLSVATRMVWVGGPAELPRLTAGYLAKARDASTVYLIAGDGKRYSFRNEDQFRSWYQNFDSLRVLSPSVIATYQLAGGVLTRPGSRLIKSSDSPRVHVMGADGKLHWVTSAAVLEQEIGMNWVSYIDVVSPQVFADYETGNTVDTTWEYRAAANGLIK